MGGAASTPPSGQLKHSHSGLHKALQSAADNRSGGQTLAVQIISLQHSGIREREVNVIVRLKRCGELIATVATSSATTSTTNNLLSSDTEEKQETSSASACSCVWLAYRLVYTNAHATDTLEFIVQSRSKTFRIQTTDTLVWHGTVDEYLKLDSQDAHQVLVNSNRQFGSLGPADCTGRVVVLNTRTQNTKDGSDISCNTIEMSLTVKRVSQSELLVNELTNSTNIKLVSESACNDVTQTDNLKVESDDTSRVRTLILPQHKMLFLIRHGESTWNRAQKARHVINMLKQTDHPLTDTGIQQAKQLQTDIGRAQERCVHVLSTEWETIGKGFVNQNEDAYAHKEHEHEQQQEKVVRVQQQQQQEQQKQQQENVAHEVAAEDEQKQQEQQQEQQELALEKISDSEPVSNLVQKPPQSHKSSRNNDTHDFESALCSADLVISSPLTRALQTALIALRMHPTVQASGMTLWSNIREVKNLGGMDTMGAVCGSASLKRAVNELSNDNDVIGVEESKILSDSPVEIGKGDCVGRWWTISKDSKEDVAIRVREVLAMIQLTSAKRVVLVGHSLFFRQLLSTCITGGSTSIDKKEQGTRSTKDELTHWQNHKIPNGGCLALDIMCASVPTHETKTNNRAVEIKETETPNSWSELNVPPGSISTSVLPPFVRVDVGKTPGETKEQDENKGELDIKKTISQRIKKSVSQSSMSVFRGGGWAPSVHSHVTVPVVRRMQLLFRDDKSD